MDEFDGKIMDGGEPMPYFMKMEPTALAFEYVADRLDEGHGGRVAMLSTDQLRRIAMHVRRMLDV